VSGAASPQLFEPLRKLFALVREARVLKGEHVAELLDAGQVTGGPDPRLYALVRTRPTWAMCQ